MLFFSYADEHFDNCNSFLNTLTYRENSFRKTQIIMTLSIPDKAKVNAKP